ncbi:hypothetical protein AYO20_08531 [Fonsecaea nubica]|uniref:Uncharacterized protein n=1 Tax=Fonsecaea nubica TaxID=856822 RepID=A0A178CNE4_9EURO|nr:hypothetical protein AYO20_08531 [Fonsecaea nubica]OAL30946.1 hypothetical protein AYO20_08531 [Fonsecaea nubica]
MKTGVILSALAGVLFSQTLAAPLVPAELAREAQNQELSSNAATPIAKRLAGTPVGTPIALPLATNNVATPIAKTPVGTPVGTPIAKRLAGTPVGTPIALPLATANGAAEEELAANKVFRRESQEDAMSPSVFAFAYLQPADEDNSEPITANKIFLAHGESSANKVFKRDLRLANDPADALSPSVFAFAYVQSADVNDSDLITANKVFKRGLIIASDPADGDASANKIFLADGESSVNKVFLAEGEASANKVFKRRLILASDPADGPVSANKGFLAEGEASANKVAKRDLILANDDLSSAGFYSIYWNAAADESLADGEASINKVFLADGEASANKVDKRGLILTDNDSKSAGFYSIYWNAASDESQDAAATLRGATAGAGPIAVPPLAN